MQGLFSFFICLIVDNWQVVLHLASAQSADIADQPHNHRGGGDCLPQHAHIGADEQVEYQQPQLYKYAAELQHKNAALYCQQGEGNDENGRHQLVPRPVQSGINASGGDGQYESHSRPVGYIAVTPPEVKHRHVTADGNQAANEIGNRSQSDRFQGAQGKCHRHINIVFVVFHLVGDDDEYQHNEAEELRQQVNLGIKNGNYHSIPLSYLYGNI